MTQTIEINEVTEDKQSSPYDLPYLPDAEQKYHKPALIFISIVHIGAIGAFFTFSWKAALLCLALHWISGGLGITLGYHRLLTHRSFQVPKFLEYFFTFCAGLACQGGPLTWVTTHRVHHAYSDQQMDPHTPLAGFFWAHMGWCLKDNPNYRDIKVQTRIAPDVANDPVHRFLEKTHILWTVLLAAILYVWGGWSFVCWGVFMRIVLVYHCTWLVNSATHVWGYQTYKSSDKSTNLWWVALMTYGEGWHNNHHAFQYSARHGLKWWEFDSTYLVIQTLELLGLAKAVKLPTKHLLSTKEF